MTKLFKFLFPLVLAACTTNHYIQQLRSGLSEAEAIALVGPPDGQVREGGTTALLYNDRIMAWSPGRADYALVFVNGRLESWGQTATRDNSAAGTAATLIGVQMLQQSRSQPVVTPTQTWSPNAFRCVKTGNVTNCMPY
jgi:hypothetical protein